MPGIARARGHGGGGGPGISHSHLRPGDGRGKCHSRTTGNDQAFLDRIERTIDGLYPPPKLLILNYPHNPTAMTIEPGFWDSAIKMCHKRNIMIISDFAYGEVNFDSYKAQAFSRRMARRNWVSNSPP